MNLGIYGTGGFGKEIYDVACRANEKTRDWESIFFIDDFKENNTSCYLSKVYTLTHILNFYSLDNLEVVIAIGEPVIRIRIKEKLKQNSIKLGKVIDPSAIISPTAILGDGIIVTSDCIIASSAIIGENVAINVNDVNTPSISKLLLNTKNIIIGQTTNENIVSQPSRKCIIKSLKCSFEKHFKNVSK